MDEISDLPYEPFDAERSTVRSQGSLDSILSEVLAQVDDVLHEQVRLKLLVDAVVGLSADGSLDGILSDMVETAARLVDAKQAAIAVYTPAPARRLRTFVQRGMDEADADALAALAGETGLLDLLRAESAPARLVDLLDRLDDAGLPHERVPVDSFLGVPVRTRSEVFGVLYLADRLDAGDFTDQDLAVVSALATAAGIAIDNARLHAEAAARERWLEATAEAVSLLATVDTAGSMPAITRAARIASGADSTWIAIGRDLGSLRLHALVTGEDDAVDGATDDFDGRLDLTHSLVAEAIDTGAPVVVEDLASDDRAAVPQLPVGRAIVLPLRSEAGTEGALGFGWHHDRDDALDDLASPSLPLIEAFTAQVALALQAARAREEAQRLALSADRGRIGSDLQGRVIQRLFGVGLGLEAASRLSDRPAVSDRLAAAVAQLDSAIADLRRSIFELDAEAADGASDETGEDRFPRPPSGD